VRVEGLARRVLACSVDSEELGGGSLIPPGEIKIKNDVSIPHPIPMELLSGKPELTTQAGGGLYKIFIHSKAFLH